MDGNLHCSCAECVCMAASQELVRLYLARLCCPYIKFGKGKSKNIRSTIFVGVCVCVSVRQAENAPNGMVTRSEKLSAMERPNMAGEKYTQNECRQYEMDKSFSAKRDGTCYAVYIATSRCLNIKYAGISHFRLAVVQHFLRVRCKYGRVRGRRRQHRTHARINGGRNDGCTKTRILTWRMRL